MKILSQKRCIIGEGPIFCEFDGLLYHVNAYANEICCIDIKTQATTVRSLNFGTAAIAFTKNGDMLISCEDGAYHLHKDGSREPLYDRARYKIQYGNDAKVGPDGKFYVGTQSSKRKKAGDALDGKLFSIDKHGEVRVLLDGLSLSNGFEWSWDESRFYHTDSDTGIIKEYLFDREGGSLSPTGREVLVPGVDGFTIDKNDRLYVACWGRGHVAVVDTADMQIKQYLPVPAAIPASCCFAGEEMDRLVVVTASRNAKSENDENAGFTFICNPGTRGRKPYLFG